MSEVYDGSFIEGDGGTIEIAYQVSCANCQTLDEQRQRPGYGKREFAQELRGWGWRKRSKYGWLCPNCCDGEYQVVQLEED